jgi:arylsulfatase
MADDMGFSDIGCYGGEVQTPSLDALAANGLRFTQFYNTARCCPTRASLLTGLHPHQAGIGWMTHEQGYRDDGKREHGPYQGWLNERCVTIPEVLGPAGYRTYMAGKWHVGTLDKDTWPIARGFDRYYGLINGASNFFQPDPNKHLTLDTTLVEPKGEDYYTTDYFTHYALSFLDQHAREHQDKPFFLYLAYTSPHWPLQAWPEDVAKYRGKYKMGWDKLRQQRLQRMREMGVLRPEWELTERDPEVPAWDTLAPDKQDELDHLMALYAAMIDRMDQNIGRLVKRLRDYGWMENTLVLFFVDNGGCAEGGNLGRYTPEKLGTREGYGPPMYGACWANASNTPFRRYKHWTHEGGISSPLIAHWPNGIPAHLNGTYTHHYGYLPDLMATCADLGNAAYPERFRNNPIPPMQGKSLAPILRGEDRPIHTTPIFWEHEGNRAVRLGKWKLVSLDKADWELYDIEADRTEMHDLAPEDPERVAEMGAAWEAWAAAVGVEPWGEPKPGAKV